MPYPIQRPTRIEFKLLTGSTADSTLDDQVNEYLKNGWHLHGQPFTVQDRGVFAQAVTRHVRI